MICVYQLAQKTNKMPKWSNHKAFLLLRYLHTKNTFHFLIGIWLTEDMAHSVTTEERHILNLKVVHGLFDRFLCKIKVPGVIFASKSAVGLKINVKVPK